MSQVGDSPARPGRLRKRAEFLEAREGSRRRGRLFTLETRRRDDDGAPRFGLTITRKCGTATERNRIRRRLRAAILRGAAGDMRPGSDYVIVARREVLDVPFADLLAELARRFRNSS